MSARRPDRVEIFTTLNHVKWQALAYHWSYVTGNGHILTDGGQGYSRRIDALRGARRVTGVDLAPSPDFTQDFDGQPRQVWEIKR
jgi:hypothetical protein